MIPTTTSYGTWTNHGDNTAPSLESTIVDALNGGDADWIHRMETAGAIDAIATDYRDAINAALPQGVTLSGNQFYGPYYDADCTWDGDLNIAEIIQTIDLWAIIDRHDVDAA